MIASPMKLHTLSMKSICARLVYEWADDDNPPVIDKWIDKRQNITCPDHDWFIWQMYEMPIPRSIVMPTPIRDQIEENMASILDPIRTWIRVHHLLKFFHEGSANWLNEYVKSIVWTKDYKVDYTSTAKKISANTNIKSMERFRFACTYCIVEDLENFTNEANIMKDWVFEKEPFMVYWSKYLAKELDTISNIDYNLLISSLTKQNAFDVSSSLVDEFLANIFPAMNGSVEGALFEIALMSYELWPPVEYFFTKLEPRMRIRRFNDIIQHVGRRDREDLLAKLGDDEWISAGRFSIKNLIVSNIDHFEDTRFIWTQFKDRMDSQNFSHMIEELLKSSMKNLSSFNMWTPFLVEIWNSVSDEFKKAAFDVELWRRVGETFIIRNNPLEDEFDFRSRHRIAEPMKFIRLVLNDMDTKNREIFLQNSFFWLIIWQPFVSVKKLLKEFLAPRSVVKFKNELKESPDVERSLRILIGFCEFEEFDVTVSYCLSGKNDNVSVSHQYLVAYKWTVIVPPVGMETMSICLYFINWRKLFEYVKKTFQNIAIPPDSYIITLFELGCIPPRDYLEEKVSKGEMRDIMDCLGFVLSSTDPRLPDLKRRFKVGLCKCLFDFNWIQRVNFKRVDMQDFLMWICSNDRALVEKNFRKPKLLRKGFLVQFKTCVDENMFEASDSMEEYLQWCFPTEEERRSFKRKMIYQYRKYDTIKDILWIRKFRQPMLNWFFDNDKSLINEFLTNRVMADREETENST